MRQLVAFFRTNPQVFVLLLICLVLGLGTFLAVLFGVVSSKSSTGTGEPSGAIRAPAHAIRALVVANAERTRPCPAKRAGWGCAA